MHRQVRLRGAVGTYRQYLGQPSCASNVGLNQIIKTLSIENDRERRDGICVALRGTIDSALSRHFQSGVPANKLFTASYSADRLLAVIDALEPSRAGQVVAWDSSTIAP